MAKNEYTNPNFPPYTPAVEGGKNKFTWIRIESHALEYQTAFTGENNDGGLVLDTSDNTGVIATLLAPNQIMETINNTWEPWETISSRMAGEVRRMWQGIKDVKSLGKTMANADWGLGMIPDTYTSLANNQDRLKFKVDTPLIYENTDRREWVLTFNLVSNSDTTAAESIQLVRHLQRYSLPSKAGVVRIDLPHVFSLQSLPNEMLLKSEYAALTSVQPTFMAPYTEDGIPFKTELTLTFKELPPLYANDTQFWTFISQGSDFGGMNDEIDEAGY
jgi:hypothetical protein